MNEPTHRCVICAVYRPTATPRFPDFPPCCEPCRARLRAELTQIPDLYSLIPASLEPATGTGVKVSGTKSPPLPIRLDALNLLHGAPGTIGAVYDPHGDQHGTVPPIVVLDLWVRDWIDVRAQSEHDPVPTISTLSAWLLNRLDWAMDFHPAIDEFAREVNLTVRAIRGVVQADRRGEEVGRCPARLRDDTRCNAKLSADPYVDLIQCGRCGSVWHRRHWLHLAAMQQDAKEAS